ncbi:MAG: hypothetical protein JWO58_2397 [Chitinophagaceae bacterium]|nr:hypothetical protein [Chitinophagaceae bacterium]
MKKILLLGLFLLSCSTAWSQSSDKSKKQNYSKNPAWIQMMDDPNANYFEAKKAFDQYWANREKPEIEGEGGVEKEKEEKRSFVSKLFKSDAKEAAEKHEYAIEYKRFIRWKMEVEPFVQPDGSILTLEQQRIIWEKSRL